MTIRFQVINCGASVTGSRFGKFWVVIWIYLGFVEAYTWIEFGGVAFSIGKTGHKFVLQIL